MDAKLLKSYRADQRPAVFMRRPIKLTSRPTLSSAVQQFARGFLIGLPFGLVFGAAFGIAYIAFMG